MVKSEVVFVNIAEEDEEEDYEEDELHKWYEDVQVDLANAEKAKPGEEIVRWCEVRQDWMLKPFEIPSPENKQAAMDNHMQLVQQILEENHFNKPALQEMATRWGLPISLITSAAASPKTLQQLVAAVTFLAV